jgi:uncharacterized membrane protein YtjA (UPF0391 family)
MYGWALIFLLLSLTAAYLGYFGFEEMGATLAKLFFVIFAALSIFAAAAGIVWRKSATGRRT